MLLEAAPFESVHPAEAAAHLPIRKSGNDWKVGLPIGLSAIILKHLHADGFEAAAEGVLSVGPGNLISPLELIVGPIPRKLILAAEAENIGDIEIGKSVEAGRQVF